MDLNAVEPGFDGVAGRLRVVADELVDFSLGHGARGRGVVGYRHGATADEVAAVAPDEVGDGGAAERP